MSIRQQSPVGRCASAALLAVALWAPGEPAAPVWAGVTFTVDSQVDAGDQDPTDGACATAAHFCTLRAAVQTANHLPGLDVIRVPTGVYTLTLNDFGEDQAASGDLDIWDDVIITPTTATARVTLEGSRIRSGMFSVLGGVLELNSLSLQHATLAGISVANAGELHLRRSTISGSGATAIVNSGATVIEASTLAGNFGPPGLPAAVAVLTGTVMVRHSTIAFNNGASGETGGLQVTGGSVHVENSVIADNLGGDCVGRLDIDARSWVRDPQPTCSLIGETVTGLDPQLAPLAEGQGATPVVRPAAHSPLINGGAGCADTLDQQGVTRPRGGACDVGAIEWPEVAFTTATRDVVAGTGVHLIPIRLDGPLPFAVQVSVQAVDEEARLGVDYLAPLGALSFAAGVTETVLPLTVLSRPGYLGDRSFWLRLGAVEARPSVPGDAVHVTIHDSHLPPLVHVAASLVRQDLPAQAVSVEVLVDPPILVTGTVAFHTQDGSARAEVDYLPVSGVLTFTPALTRASVSIGLLPGWHAGDREFRLTLSAPTHLRCEPEPFIRVVLHDTRTQWVWLPTLQR